MGNKTDNNHFLFEQLFKRDLPANDTAPFLTALTKEHPYFAAAQFYLLQKTVPGSSDFASQAARTAILFNNPLWLNFQMEQSVESEVPPEQKVVPDEQKFLKALDENAVPEKTNKILANKEERKTIAPEENNISIENTMAGEDVAFDKACTATADSSMNGAQKPVAPEHNKADDTSGSEYDGEAEETPVDEREISPMNIRLAFTPDKPVTEETISYQPLYTSDYFASLGIKINEETKPADKLGKQLKSFTEWLKTMKKVHPEQLPEEAEQTDIMIQKIADKSNTNAEVLTEAMADVFFQQGKAQKAIEVYQKLSLLDPAKSAYFAAKIDQIKR